MSNKKYAVIDLEFYKNKTKLFNIKQIGVIVFDENYYIDGRFERTIINREDISYSKEILTTILDCVDNIFIWGGAADIKHLQSIGINLSKYELIDIQPYFNMHLGKDNNTLSATYYKVFKEQPEGVHNAIVDCFCTYEIIKEFDLVNSHFGINKYITLIKGTNSMEVVSSLKSIKMNEKLDIIDDVDDTEEDDEEDIDKSTYISMISEKDIQRVNNLPKNKAEVFQKLTILDIVSDFSISEKEALILRQKLQSRGYPLAPVTSLRPLKDYIVSIGGILAGEGNRYIVGKNIVSHKRELIKLVANEYFNSSNIVHIPTKKLYKENVEKEEEKHLKKSFVRVNMGKNDYDNLSNLLGNNKINNFQLLNIKVSDDVTSPVFVMKNS